MIASFLSQVISHFQQHKENGFYGCPFLGLGDVAPGTAGGCVDPASDPLEVSDYGGLHVSPHSPWQTMVGVAW